MKRILLVSLTAWGIGFAAVLALLPVTGRRESSAADMCTTYASTDVPKDIPVDHTIVSLHALCRGLLLFERR